MHLFRRFDLPVASIFRVAELGSCDHATCTIRITLHDVVTQNKAVCQYRINESHEGGLRMRIRNVIYRAFIL